MLQKVKNTLIYFFIRALLACAGILPWRPALAAGGFLGWCFQAAVPRERERACANLKLAFPELPEPQRRRLARNTFIALGRTSLEFLALQALDGRAIARLVEAVEGRAHMEAALAKGKGVVCLTAHLGNWEILPVFTTCQGWPSAVVAQELYDPRLDRLLNRFREQRGVQVLKRGQITAAIARCLKSNRLLGILNDQDTDVDSRWAPFFNRPAKTPVGALRLARRLGAAVVPIFIARAASGRNRVYIEPELSLPHTADEGADLLEGARLCNHVIETYIRRFPEQWVWFHQRWKSPPPAE